MLKKFDLLFFSSSSKPIVYLQFSNKILIRKKSFINYDDEGDDELFLGDAAPL